MRKSALVIFALLAHLFAFSQEIVNIRVSQTGSRVNLLYDLAGKGQVSKVDLYYSVDDGNSWTGPLKNVSGNIRGIASPATNLTITWDGMAENPGLQGELQFRLVADFIEERASSKTVKRENKTVTSDHKYRSAKNLKTVFMVTALVAAGTGAYSYTSANKLYDEYHTALDNSADLREKINTLDKVYPVAFIAAGVSTVAAILQATKQSKIKRNLKINPAAFNNGAGASLVIHF